MVELPRPLSLVVSLVFHLIKYNFLVNETSVLTRQAQSNNSITNSIIPIDKIDLTLNNFQLTAFLHHTTCHKW